MVKENSDNLIELVTTEREAGTRHRSQQITVVDAGSIQQAPDAVQDATRNMLMAVSTLVGTLKGFDNDAGAVANRLPNLRFDNLTIRESMGGLHVTLRTKPR